eukprot:TRINITY_DN1036_c3_g1_i4.p1 TRINITY_DN1036_c3_g1~~TRINITY_DN1036_c3_g1_i4.p1  ORF type:complete len:173 (+),score=45.38 TRINITY_DN1036_c3_g1_i4:77-520(+)
MLRRIQKEAENFNRNPPPGISGGPVEQGNLMHWKAMIVGPEDSPYKGGLFELDIKIQDSYPMKPPKMVFVTKIVHPNIHPDGRICLDVLGGWDGSDTKAWSPAFTIEKVLLMLQSLLSAPNFDDPWVKIKPDEWPGKAAEGTRKHAM